MLQLRLVIQNGKYRGNRLPVRETPMLIGRGKDCDMRLGGSSVSRRHCMVRQSDEGFAVMDLGSRNGTIINETKLSSGEEEFLWHEDRLQIGDWILEALVMDDQTRQPHHRRASAGDGILDELDELNAAMEAGHATWMQLGSTDPTASGDAAVQSDADATGEAGETTLSESPAESEHETSASAETDGASETQVAAKKDDSASDAEDLKIPAHLRPKGPVDSQDAANEALRRIFGR